MSSQDIDVDISVVSSPEPSPRPDDRSPSHNDYYASSNNNHHHHHTLNHSIESRLSPPKTPPDASKSAGSPYTSFSITSILSRNEPKKGPVMPMATLPMVDANGSHDAAMLSRYIHCFYNQKNFGHKI